MRARAATVAMLRPLATKPENFDQVRTLTRFFFTLTSSPLQGVGSSSRETNLGGLYSVASKAIWFHETPTIPTYSIIKSTIFGRICTCDNKINNDQNDGHQTKLMGRFLMADLGQSSEIQRVAKT